MLKPISVKDALHSETARDAIFVQGWVRTRRDAKGFSFIDLNDGSCLKNLQIIAPATLANYSAVQHLTTGASVAVRGKLVPSQGQGQKWEVTADEVTVIGTADATYPLQKKGHTPEFLREIAHLRPRSNLFGAVFRTRSRLAFAIHQFFQERGFVYMHAPIITGSDCEGAGELFRVTTLDLANPPKTGNGLARNTPRSLPSKRGRRLSAISPNPLHSTRRSGASGVRSLDLRISRADGWSPQYCLGADGMPERCKSNRRLRMNSRLRSD